MPALWVLEAIYVVKEGWVSQCTFMTIEEVEGAARRGSGPTTTNGPGPARRYILSHKHKLQNAGTVRFRHMRAAVDSHRFGYDTTR
ncbi:hypothetical protein OAS67_10205 [Alphaproteobacteria bacterium]|jgi:hypothetical protein|nr:hypothetical protein [Alphaproteobacteria bacterium]